MTAAYMVNHSIEDVRDRPCLSGEQAVRLVRERYGLTAAAKELPSERDQNFHLVTDSGEEFVLKLSNSSASAETLDCQNQAMARLARSAGSGTCPATRPGLDGQTTSVFDGQDGRQHFVRLVSYLAGVPLAKINDPTPDLLKQLGTLIGSISRAMEGFDHLGARRSLQWDLNRAMPVIHEHVDFLDDAVRRKMIDFYSQQYDAVAGPQIGTLRTSVIHNDCNDYNLIVEEQANRSDVSVAVIDFGDLVYSCTINELAIAIAYIMLDKPDPIATAACVVGAYHKQFPLEESEIAVVFPLAIMRLCVSVVLSSYQRSLQPDNEYLSITEQAAWRLLEQLQSVEPRFAEDTFRTACDMPSTVGVRTRQSDAILVARRRHLAPSLSLSYGEPLHIVRGSRQYLFDDRGRAYLDCVNNVCHVGHCHPHVVAAAQSQIETLNTNTRYLHENIVELAERLAATLPKPLEVCFFVNSGSEANDLALRLARNYTGNDDVVVVDGAYHGNLTSLIDISPYKFDGPGGRGMPSHVRKIPMPDVYRGTYSAHDTDAGEKYAKPIADAMNESRDRGATFICESILSCGGQIVLPEGFLKHAYRHVAHAGGVCIADEVQVGLGRVGTHFWGFESQGVIPDIVTIGKPFGNGHPLAAVVTTRDIADRFANGMEYFNTFGGNPVSCAIGLAVLDVIQDEQLQQNALVVGSYLKAGLGRIKERHESVGDVRGLGLFLGIEFVDNNRTRRPAQKLTRHIVEQLKREHILLSVDGPHHNVIKIKPPMTFSKLNADRVLAMLEECLRNSEVASE